MSEQYSYYDLVQLRAGRIVPLSIRRNQLCPIRTQKEIALSVV
jgi:hypothetical protein